MAWLPKKSVVVPTDFSEESFAALDTALALVEKPAHIHVVHVLPTVDPVDLEAMWTTVDNASRSGHAQQALRERLKDAKYAGVQVEVAFGDPGHEITALAEKVAAELIVLPSHGRTGLTRLLIGSVAERVVRLAHCPVLVLRK